MDTFYSVQESFITLNEEHKQEQADEQERLQLEDTYYILKADKLIWKTLLLNKLINKKITK